MTTRDRPTTPSRAPRGGQPARDRPGEAGDEPLRRWESLVERQIRDAQEAGQFDDLPYQGEPLPPVDDAWAGEMAGAFRILRNAGVAPAWVEADKEVRRLLDERARLLEQAPRTGPLSRPRLRARLDAVIRAHNTAVLRLNHEAPSARQHRAPLDVDAELGRLDATWRSAHEPGR